MALGPNSSNILRLEKETLVASEWIFQQEISKGISVSSNSPKKQTKNYSEELSNHENKSTLCIILYEIFEFETKILQQRL